MIRIWSTLFILSFSLSCVTTPENDFSEPTGLWEISDGRAKSYLMGTIHMGVSFTSLPDIYQRKLNQSQVVITEVDPWEMTQEEIVQHSFLPKEKRLDELLGYFYWLKLKKSLPDIPEPFLSRMKPSTATIILLGSLIESSEEVKATQANLKEDSGISMDVEISILAREDKKNMFYLETTMFQMELLEKIYDVPSLKDLLDNKNDVNQSVVGAVVSYKQGTMQNTVKLIEEMPKKQKEIFLDQRNRRWSEILPRFFKSGDAFVAVGLGHLVGDQGLLELLRQQGFQVRRIHSGVVPKGRFADGRLAR